MDIITFQSNTLKEHLIKQHNEKDHMVFPVVAARAQVMNGLYYSPDALKMSSVGWNGTPLVVNHPGDVSEHFSANSPSVLDKYQIGKMFNVTYEQDKLKGELWLNIEDAQNKGFGDLVDRLKNKESIEVSTGLYSKVTNKQGTHNGENYTGSVYNILPDHLAILPDTVGACSVADGCGTFQNEKQDDKKENKIRHAVNMLKGFFGLSVNDLSHNDMYGALDRAIATATGVEQSYVVDVFDKKAIYMNGNDYYAFNYMIGDDDEVSLVGDAYKVKKNVTYVPVDEAKKYMNEEFDMKNNEGCGCGKVNGTEDTAVVTPGAEPAPAENKMTVESIINFLANADSKDKTELIEHLANEKKKADLIAKIIENSDIKHEQLVNVDVTILETLANNKKSDQPTAFLGRGGAANKYTTEVPQAPSVLLNTKEAK